METAAAECTVGQTENVYGDGLVAFVPDVVDRGVSDNVALVCPAGNDQAHGARRVVGTRRGGYRRH